MKLVNLSEREGEGGRERGGREEEREGERERYIPCVALGFDCPYSRARPLFDLLLPLT
jgi:hypothetical protein